MSKVRCGLYSDAWHVWNSEKITISTHHLILIANHIKNRQADNAYKVAEEAKRRWLVADSDGEEMSLHPKSLQNEVKHNEMSILHI